jgi:hypothetical protein
MTKERNLKLKALAEELREKHPTMTRKDFSKEMTEATKSEKHPNGIVTALRKAIDEGFNGDFKSAGAPIKTL